MLSSPKQSFRKFNGHTVRRGISSSNKLIKRTEMELRRCPPVAKKPQGIDFFFDEKRDADEVVDDIPVTAVDDFLQSSVFRFREQASFTWRDIHIDSNSDDDEDNDSMCKDNSRADKWLTLEQALQRHAVSVKREFVLKDDLLVTHYDVPIVGHYQLVDPSAKERERERAGYREVRVGGFPRHWLQWKGRHYDPALIYEQVGGRGEEASSLRAVCPAMRVHALKRVFAKRNEERDNNDVEKDTLKLPLLCRSVFSASQHQVQKRKKYKNKNKNKNKKNNKRKGAGNSPKKCLYFDLRGLSDVQAIGTMGGYPKTTAAFPVDHKSSDGSRVEVLPSDEAAQQWVKSFSLQFRDERDGKWRMYSDPYNSSSTFVANEDIGTEVLHRVVLHARYLRITPLEAHNGKEMRVNVYGVHLAAEEDTTREGRSTAAEQQQRDGEEGERVAQTVRYSLYPPRYREFTLNNQSHRPHCDGRDPQERKIKDAKKFINREITQSFRVGEDNDH